jgi:hypothetical protein
VTRVAVELRPGQWVQAELRPDEYGTVLTRLAKADGERLRRDPALLRNAPELLRRVHYRRELGERWESPETTLRQGWGDCDNIGRTLAALGAARGYPSSVWVGYPSGRSVGARHAIGVVDGRRGDLSGWSELWQAVKRGSQSALPKLREVSRELSESLESPYWRWALTAAPVALGLPPAPYGEWAARAAREGANLGR